MIIKRIHLTGNSNISYWGILIWGMALMFSCQEKEFNTFTPVGSGTPHTDILDILQRGSFETDAFITEWTVPKDSLVTFTLDTNRQYNCIIDWGDNSDLTMIFNKSDYNRAQHKYAATATYRIKILGIFPQLNIQENSKPYLYQIIQWGNVSFQTLSLAFFKCENLYSIAAGIPNLESYSSTFSHCTGLVTLPDGLFSNCTKSKSFPMTFSNCINLKSLPPRLFKDCYNAENFAVTFQNTGLISLPQGLFENCSKVTNFTFTFGNCKNLTTLPADLFSYSSNVTSFMRTFSSCNNLYTIPISLFDNCKKVINFSYTFSGCSSLTGTTPITGNLKLWDRAGQPGYPPTINGVKCFGGCLNITDNIPADWR